MKQYKCPECDMILPSSIYAHVCKKKVVEPISKVHPVIQAFYDVDGGRYKNNLMASGFNICCSKCKHFDKFLSGSYRCRCLGSCPGADLSEELKNHILHSVKTREFYYLQHKVCPSCHSTDYTATTAGSIFNDYDSYNDSNRVTCVCGYVGTIHDLVPEKRTT